MRPQSVRGSLAWCAADVRSLLPGASAGLMQLMYPPLGQAVMEHSAFVEDPFGRVYRSIPQIWATILTPEGTSRARGIRDLHRDIKGTEPTGTRYHALDPDTFWWAHASFTWEMFRSIELFHGRQLTQRERDAFYAETVEWYERYGVSTRPVPADLAAFERRFTEICHDVLELTPAAAYAVAIAERNPLGVPLPVPSPARVVAFGCMPSALRTRLGIGWTAGDRRAFAVFRRVVSTGGAVVPVPINQRALRLSLRRVGARTRDQRYRLSA
ncbi:MAG TPA: oxygenase MpaB family protein [Acidimicrobiales bacterium]|nr:oxygenase MpaB family protein [Acidimicrobiales bacterium]